jgi:two-component system nitrate/nitrite response regulator NarL
MSTPSPDTPSGEQIRVMLVDDHVVIRSGLRLLIESQPGLRVIGEAGSRTDALAVAEREQPDIILLDLDLPGTDGYELLPDLLHAARQARVLILTGVTDLEAHIRALKLGAIGVVLKEKAPEVLIKAIRGVYAGEIWLDPAAVAKLLGQGSGEAQKPDREAAKIATLTEREREIIALVGEGLKNKQIASRLFISEGTVRNYLTTIFSKLEVADRFELILHAYRHKLAKPRL